jgi:hypothetical protein
MLQWLREAVSVLPPKYANLLLFCTLTGMRRTECIEAIRVLLNGNDTRQYYDTSRCILQHYLYPEIFIRRTKGIYISVVNDEIIRIAQKIGKLPTPKALEHALVRRCLSMRIKYCR